MRGRTAMGLQVRPAAPLRDYNAVMFRPLTAFLSTVFLASYLARFATTGAHRYPGTGGDKTFYLVLLGTHTVLAAAAALAGCTMLPRLPADSAQWTASEMAAAVCHGRTTSEALVRAALEQVGMLEHDLHRALPALGQLDNASSRITLKVAVNADSLDGWFVGAVARFCDKEQALVDTSIDDQEHTAEWLRTGAVLAAVTSSAKPVQGCRSIPLGHMPYVATASPAFVRRWFPDGVTAEALAQAPCMTFNRKDRLQSEWVRQVCGHAVEMPRHWLPSSQAFVAGALAGLGWGMNPLAFVADHLRRGRLVRLVPGSDKQVPLHWQHARLQIPMLDRLTDAVVGTAKAALEP